MSTSLPRMFYGANKFNGDVSQWDVSRVNNMYEAFCYASSFNGELNEWDTSSVRHMGVGFLISPIEQATQHTILQKSYS